MSEDLELERKDAQESRSSTPRSRSRASSISQDVRARALSLPNWTSQQTYSLPHPSDEVSPTSASSRLVTLSRGRSATIANSVSLELSALLEKEWNHDQESPADEDMSEAAKRTKICCCWFTGNQLSLLTMAFLFGLITIVQFVFATIANSVALQADCLSMGVDTATYLSSLLVECLPNKDPNFKEKMQLGMAGLSYAILMLFTTMFLAEGIQMLQPSDDDGGDDEVNGYIVLGFALGGILFDVGSLLVFSHFGESDETAAEEDEEKAAWGINANLLAALAHVMSDTLRSTTTFIEGIVLLSDPNIDSTKADGLATVTVCTIIGIGTLGALYMWVQDLHVFLQNAEHGIRRSDVELDTLAKEPRE